MTLLRMAAGYRQSCAMIRLRICALKDAEKSAGPEERANLKQRIQDLSSMYRDASEIARVLEHYYDRRYRQDERDTV